MSLEETLKYQPDLTVGACVLLNCLQNEPQNAELRAAWAEQLQAWDEVVLYSLISLNILFEKTLRHNQQ